MGKGNAMTAIIHQFAVGADNFGVLVHDPSTGATASIDAGDEAPILAALGHKGWKLTDILITHHHSDHIAALSLLKARLGARVVAPHADRHRIPDIDLAVGEGDHVQVGSIQFLTIETPGHTSGHVSFYSASEKLLFAGDTLFFWVVVACLKAQPNKCGSHLSVLLPCRMTHVFIADMNIRFRMQNSQSNMMLIMQPCVRGLLRLKH